MSLSKSYTPLHSTMFLLILTLLSFYPCHTPSFTFHYVSINTKKTQYDIVNIG